MAVTITAAQRDALYERILDRLSGIEDVWRAACAENYEVADRLGREYSDELRLVVDDLGWGEESGEATVELTTEPDLLRRVFSRLRESAADERAAQATSWAESRMFEERNRLVDETCASVLQALDESA